MNKKLRFFLIGTLTLAIALGLIYLMMDKESKELNEETRKELSGQFIRLPNGVVHYELSGDASKPIVVLVHGFSSPLYVFDPTAEFLLANGYRVLRFDLFGRGFSDRIENSNYGIDLYVSQLHDLLIALDIKEPINLLGLSMGGAIVTHFSNRHPEMINTLSLVAPLYHTPARPEVALVKTPGLGEFLGKVVLVPKFIKGAAETVYDERSFPDWAEKFSPQTAYKGFSYALVQTARFLSGKSFKAEYEKLGSLAKPVLLVWGKQDKVLPFEDSEKVRAAVPESQFYTIDQAGHLPHYEQADKVNGILLDFLKQPR